MTYVYWDIETEPMGEIALSRFRPEFEAPSNYKDPAKIEANIIEQAEAWNEKTALDAKTACILCAGVAVDNDAPVLVEGHEHVIIGSLLELFVDALKRGAVIVGFNSERFDWPFLRHRTLLNGMYFPRGFLSPWKGRYYWSEQLRDAYLLWTLGQTVGSVSNGMDNLAKAFGIPGKTGDGIDFAKQYRTDPETARAYLRQDIEITRALWQRLNAGGPLPSPQL